MSWNNIIPAWLILPCKECKEFHPPGQCKKNMEVQDEMVSSGPDVGNPKV
jgi:hypothetical protein